MKRKLAVIFYLVLLTAFILTSCAPKKVNMILATGCTSGIYYPLGGAMAQIINTKFENTNVTAQATGASLENCKLLGAKEAELAIIQNDMLDYAYEGIEYFEGGRIENLRIIGTLYPEIVQIVVIGDSGIDNVKDLKGKRVSVGAPGSEIEANVRQIFEVTNLSYNDMIVSYLSFSESTTALKDKHIDGFFVTTCIPNSEIKDISAQYKISVVSLSDEDIKNLTEKYPFFVEYIIPADTYNGQTSDVKTVAIMATLATYAEVDDDVVYNITKSLFDNLDELEEAHAKGKEITLEGAVKGISIPFHPGAEKYFKEKGLM